MDALRIFHIERNRVMNDTTLSPSEVIDTLNGLIETNRDGRRCKLCRVRPSVMTGVD